MSRSYRHKQHYPITCAGWNGSIKKDKRLNNQKLRTVAKRILKATEDYDNMSLPYRLEEVMERWSYVDDGRHYIPLRWILEESEKPWEYLRK